MADPKKNPLIGVFRTPMPEESPPGKAEEKKPPGVILNQIRLRTVSFINQSFHRFPREKADG